MFSLLPCVLASALAGVTVVARAANPDDGSAERVRPAAIEAHVRFLADDLLEGRGTGQRGHEIAARYVAAQFAQYGLMPGAGAGPDGWYQSFRLVESAPMSPAARAELIAADGSTRTLEYGTHFIPAVDYRQPEVVIEAPLAFVGYGIHAPEFGHDDFADIDLRGRIAVVFSGSPKKLPDHARAYYSDSQQRLGGLIQRGAVGVITIDTPEEEQRVPWERKLKQAWRPRMRALDASGAPIEDYRELRGRFSFSRPAAELLFEGAPESYASVIAKAQAGEPQRFELPGRVRLKTVSQLRELRSANVLGLLPGSDPLLAQEVIVVTAHLDHIGRGLSVGSGGGDQVYNGAHDNASGIATLLETARVLAAGQPPKRSVLFAAVTAEENGLIGSDVLARGGAGAGRRFVANVNMDMPTALVPTRDFVAFGAEHSTLGPVAARAAEREGYVLSPDPRPEEVVFIRSDQYSFVRQGIPAIYLDGGDQAVDPAVDAGALVKRFLQERYHTVTDDLSAPMDFATLAGLARVNLRILEEVGNAPRAPEWLPGDFFGERFAKPVRTVDTAPAAKAR
jgi:hypothetical protein